MRAWCAPRFASPLPHLEPVCMVNKSRFAHSPHTSTFNSPQVAELFIYLQPGPVTAKLWAFTVLFVITLVSGGISGALHGFTSWCQILRPARRNQAHSIYIRFLYWFSMQIVGGPFQGTFFLCQCMFLVKCIHVKLRDIALVATKVVHVILRSFEVLTHGCMIKEN